jgi:hypothetical protein
MISSEDPAARVWEEKNSLSLPLMENRNFSDKKDLLSSQAMRNQKTSDLVFFKTNILVDSSVEGQHPDGVVRTISSLGQSR